MTKLSLPSRCANCIKTQWTPACLRTITLCNTLYVCAEHCSVIHWCV